MDDQTIDETLLQAGIIYTGQGRNELLARAEEFRRSGCLVKLNDGLDFYLTSGCGVPARFAKEIVRYNRKLSGIDIGAINLQRRIEQEGYDLVKVVIEPSR